MFEQRIQKWEKTDEEGRYVLYKMQASVRFEHNLALIYAVEEANRLNLPLRVLYTLYTDFPDANKRHFQFLCEGLMDFACKAAKEGYEFRIEVNPSEARLAHYLNHAVLIVLDKGYLRIERKWLYDMLYSSNKTIVQVEDNLLVPVQTASDKMEWAARTFRPKVMQHFDDFIGDIQYIRPDELVNKIGFTLGKIDDLLEYFLEKYHGEELPAVAIRGGETLGMERWKEFLATKFKTYAEDRNDPSLHGSSGISPYLHFGQVSPLQLLKEMYVFLYEQEDKEAYEHSKDVLIEQLIVRRELAHNFIWYNPLYDNYEGLPAWCKDTLDKHGRDERPYIYELNQLEAAETHDPYWNRAMQEMITTGTMENTMRMYWGKKIMEWTSGMQEAYRRMLYLNNKYFLDGRDANSYTGVGWCFGLHDRPWGERAVFGTVRYMNADGLKRKYEIDAY